MTLAEGSVVLGRYVVEAPLGAGGMGYVVRARHARLGTPVAVKVLSAADDEGLTRRFEREAALMALVRHPNVVEILDFGTLDDGAPCIVMELVHGASLATLIQHDGGVPWPTAVVYALQMLEGLAAIHAANVIHRDLKPSNVMIGAGPPPVVKLLDFGIARPAAATATRLTRTGASPGTPAYMAPEQLMGGAIGVSADVYAVGLILHEMLTGRLPFEDEAGVTTLRRFVHAPGPPRPAPGVATWPDALGDLVARALAIDPRDRPPTAEALGDALRRARLEPPGKTVLPPSTPPASMDIRVDAATEIGSVVTAPTVAPVQLLVAVRVPPSFLQRNDERRFLATLAGSRGRTFAANAVTCIVVRTEPARDAAVESASRIEREIAERYGTVARVHWDVVAQPLTFTAGMLSGAAPLPDALLELVARADA